MSKDRQPDFLKRLDKVREAIKEKELDALLVFSPANRRYLTGFTAADGRIGESSGSVLVSRDRAALLVSPLYSEQARHESRVVESMELRERATKLLPGILDEWKVRRLGFERDYTLYGFYEDLKEGLKGKCELVSAKGIVEPLRITKDASEQETMREAARIGDEAYVRVVGSIKPGMTERQVARAMDELMLELGAEAPSFPTIVAAGTNSARPHHEPGNTVIKAGDPIVVDMGARYRGYCSDITRSFCLGTPDDRYHKIYDLVLKAHDESKRAVRSDANGKDVDAVARNILTEAGYEKEFGHSLGHGVGIDVHEGPSLSKISEDTLAPGMVVTIEPALYISDWGGVRIEDTVMVTEDGCEQWTHAPKSAVI